MAEKKVKLVEILANSFNTTATMIDLTPITQDATSSGRIGTKVLCSSLELQLSIHPTVSVNPSTVTSNCKIVVFIWRDDTAPVQGTLFDPLIGTPASPANIPLMPFSSDQKVKRKVLWTKNVISCWQISVLGPPLESHVFSGQVSWTRKIVIPLTRLKNKLNEINYIPGGVSGINKIYLCFASSDAPQAANGRILHGVSRINFIDM